MTAFFVDHMLDQPDESGPGIARLDLKPEPRVLDQATLADLLAEDA